MNAATQPAVISVSRKSALRLAAGVLIAAIMMWLASRQVEWDGLSRAFSDMRPFYAVAAVTVLLLTYLAVAFRWSLLLPRELNATPSAVLPAVMIGYLVNTVVPVRLGDLARAAILGRRFPISLYRTLGTIYAEHLLDLLLLIVVLGIFAVAIDLPVAARTALLVGAFAALVLTTIVASVSPPTVVRILRILPYSARWAAKIEVHLAGFVSGFDALKGRRNLVFVSFATALVWTFLSLSAFSWALAFDLQVPWYGIVFALVLAGLGAAIPATPAAIGTYQVATILALSVWTDDASKMFVYSIMVHASQLIANVLIGGIFAVRYGMRPGQPLVPQATEDPQ